jgi:uncharacterized protein YdeI (YjbR/CyaY-like superfamily)
MSKWLGPDRLDEFTAVFSGQTPQESANRRYVTSVRKVGMRPAILLPGWNMRIGKTIYVVDRIAWREWLEANFRTEPEIWLIYPDKESGKPRLSYNDAVEEALSFGWIDSTVKRFDEHSLAQRFSPRSPRSEYSQANKERLKWLAANGRLHPSVRDSAEQALREEFVFPSDILQAIRANRTAWKNYQQFSPSYKRIRIAYIEGARSRPDEFKKRLNSFIANTEKGRLIGYGGIEKYY